MSVVLAKDWLVLGNIAQLVLLFFHTIEILNIAIW